MQLKFAKNLGADGGRLQVIFVTVDPERDKPKVLKNYVASFDSGFLGLYGDKKRTRQVADAFHIYYRKVPTGSSYTMDHTAITYVFDTQGKLRLAVRHEQTPEQITADLRLLLQTNTNS